MTKNKGTQPHFLKIVYFDEGSALDYLEAAHGGRYDKVSSDIIQSVKKIAGEVSAEASTDPKILSFVVDSLFGLKGKIGGSGSYNRDKDKKISETVSSTVLSNFIDEIFGDKDGDENTRKNFGIFSNTRLAFIPDSVTYLKMIAPMLKIIREESLGNDMPIQLSALDQIFSEAKGYYDLVSIEEDRKVFRFNFDALRNNYRLNDLTKMNIKIVGIKVGECTESQLDWEAEFSEDQSEVQQTDTRSAFENILGREQGHTDEELPNNNEKKLSIYDVILAGVANDGN
ncbi:DUF6414 family protein [Halobacillus litoralis]|uniref:DUF6414 family protein n=1 Tax=Halobacillus litoralis TaxID=45668 RepID=UPI001CD69663|nr:DUF6414 family protein [Halobacillus litoralis]MCA0972270.1 DUF6414 family protein [Halobacillus litoralis]